MEKIKTILTICLIVAASLFIKNELYPSNAHKSLNNIYENLSCENMSLQDTLGCLKNNIIIPNYNYKIQPTNKNKTLEDIRTTGGDCSDYTAVWRELLNNFGFKTRIIQIPILNLSSEKIEIAPNEYIIYKNYLSHMFLLVYDKEGYCLVDIMDVNCILYSQTEIENFINNSNLNIVS